MNVHVDIYTKYIEMFELKNEVVKVICEELSKTSWVSNFLQNSLNYLFETIPAKKEEFKGKALALGLTLPPNIPALHI